MPSPPFRPDADEMLIPAFLVTNGNEAELAAWQAEHPDWFVAGTWTPGPASAGRDVGDVGPGEPVRGGLPGGGGGAGGNDS